MGNLQKQERKNMATLDVFNYFINFESGENCLVYKDAKLTNIGEASIKRWAEKVTGDKVIDIYHVPQEDLQYYCIDGRVWIDTQEKAQKLLDYINS